MNNDSCVTLLIVSLLWALGLIFLPFIAPIVVWFAWFAIGSIAVCVSFPKD